MAFSWYSLILFVGVVQGVFFALALWTKQSGNQQANRFLAAFALAFAIILADEFVEDIALFREYPLAIGLLWPAVYAIGPLFWWYVRSMIEGRITFGRNQLTHLIPTALSSVIFLPLITFNTTFRRSLIFNTDTVNEVSWPLLLVLIIFLTLVFHTGYYVIKSLRYIRAYNHSLPDTYSYDEDINLRWLNYLSLVFFGLWAFFLIGEFIGGTVGNLFVTIVDLDMVVILFLIGFFATRQVTAPTDIAISDTDLASAEITPPKYQSSALSAEQADYIQQQLLTLMQTEHPYREGKLTLPQLASQLNTSPNYLSQIINERLERNFFDFVNQYRIDEAQQRLLAEPNRTILDIALASGFNSKSAFYKVFKQQTGTTPSAYRKSHRSFTTPERN